jgi:hypothetical protein
MQVGSPWFTILFARKTEEKMDAATRAISALETLDGAFRNCSGGGKPFFGGDGIGFVDIVLGSYLGWFVVIEKMIGVTSGKRGFYPPPSVSRLFGPELKGALVPVRATGARP